MSKIYKKCLILLFIVLFQVAAFAEVTDNDGSAFITKAEFDALKSQFQSSIDQYNVSIDSKIDNAIASYLSGIVINPWQTKKVDTTSLSYPLTFSHTNYFDTNRDAHYSTAPLWAPSFNFYNTHNRVTYYCYFHTNYNPTNTLTEFMNYSDVVTVGSTKYAVINDIYDNYKSVYTCFNACVDHRLNHTGQQLLSYQSAIIFGVNANTGQARVTASPKVFAWAQVASKKSPNNAALSWYTAVTYDTNYSTGTVAITDTGASVPFTNTGNWWSVGAGSCNVSPSWVTSYDSKSLNKIYNNTGMYIPCTKDGVVILSNYPNAAKEMLSSAFSTTCLNANSWTPASISWQCKSMICPPYSIMDSDWAIAKYASTPLSDQWQTSIHKSDNLCYSIHDTMTGVASYQPMTQGVYLTTMDVADVEVNMHVKITAPDTNTYLIIREAPITDNTYNSANNIMIKNGTTSARYLKCTSGTHEYDIAFDANKNKKLYYKLVNTGNKDSVMVEPPTMLTKDK